MDTASGEELQPGRRLWELGRPRFKFWEDGGQTPTKHILSTQGRNVCSSPGASREHRGHTGNINHLPRYGKPMLGTSTAGTSRQVTPTPASHWEFFGANNPKRQGQQRSQQCLRRWKKWVGQRSWFCFFWCFLLGLSSGSLLVLSFICFLHNC